VYCIGLNVIFSEGSETKFDKRVRYVFLQMVNKDSFCFKVKDWGVIIMTKQQTPSHRIFILGFLRLSSYEYTVSSVGNQEKKQTKKTM
jgi:hypothetical protein